MTEEERAKLKEPSDFTAAERISELIRRHEAEESFSVEWFNLSKSETKLFVRLRNDPPHFTPSIFSSAWRVLGKHPLPEEIRIVRVLTGFDGVSRVIGRQGKYLYVAPWD